MSYKTNEYKESDFTKPIRPSRVKTQNFVGKKYGKLYVLEMAGVLNHFVYYKCKCDCGKITFIRSNQLQQGNAKSCGCGIKEGLETYNQQKTKRLFHIFCKYRRLLQSLFVCRQYMW